MDRLKKVRYLYLCSCCLFSSYSIKKFKERGAVVETLKHNGNGAALLVFKILAYRHRDGRTHVRTDSHVSTKVLRSMGY